MKKKIGNTVKVRKKRRNGAAKKKCNNVGMFVVFNHMMHVLTVERQRSVATLGGMPTLSRIPNLLSLFITVLPVIGCQRMQNRHEQTLSIPSLDYRSHFFPRYK